MFNFDKKTFIIILAVLFIINLLDGGLSLKALLFSVPGLLVAMTFHEFAHAYAADKLGDNTPRMQGRLTLNPIKHIDILGILCLAFCGFGWGKPVQIDSRNFDGKYSISKAEAIVAIAGPLMNFFIAFITIIIYYALYYFGVFESMTYNIYSICQLIIYSIITINLSLRNI